MRNFLELGKWNVLCDRCGLQFKNTALRDEWTGLKVCKDCWETRHPQTLIRVPKDDSSTPWSRPEPTDVFIGDSPIEAEDGSFLFTESQTILNTET